MKIGRNIRLVLDVMEKTHGWYSLGGLQAAIDDKFAVYISEAGISARIRDLRKPKYGGRTVDKRRRSKDSDLWEYRLRPQFVEGQGELFR